MFHQLVMARHQAGAALCEWLAAATLIETSDQAFTCVLNMSAEVQVEECSEHAAAHLTHVQASQHACLTPAHSQASTIHVPSPSFDYPAGGFGHSRRYIPHEDAGSVCLESASSLTSSSTLF